MAIPGNPRGKYYLLGDTLELLNPKSMATYQLSRRKQFGPVWQTSVLFNKCIFVSGAENLRQLSDQERLHKNTTACFPPHHRALFGQHSVLVTSGEEHATLRSLITPSLQPSLYEEEIQMAVVAFVSRCKKNKEVGDYFPLVREFKQFACSVALRIVLGEVRWQKWMTISNDAGNCNNTRLLALLDDFSIWSKGLLSPPTSFIPFTQSYYAMMARKRIRKALLEVIEEEKRALLKTSKEEGGGSSRDENHRQCLIKRLLSGASTIAAQKKEMTHDNDAMKEKSSFITEEAIVDNIFTLVFAGTDTTASVLTSAFFELAKNAELRERLQTSIDKEEQEKSVAHTSTADELIRAFLSEVQRCYPSAPFTMRNISETGVNSRGIDLGNSYGLVPPKFNITYALAGTLLDDEHSYPNPKEFDLDRWLPKKQGSKPPPIWAFGGGCRTCPGRFLSIAESVALLRSVLSKKDGFQWTLKEGQDLNFSYTPGFFPKDGLMVKIV